MIPNLQPSSPSGESISASAPPRRGVAAVIVRDEKLLVIRRSQTVVAPGAVCFPGGGIEDGETEEQALVRELREELGLTVLPVRRLWQSVTPWRVALSWWLADVAEGAAIAPNPAEVAAAYWLSPAEMAGAADLLPSNRDFLAALAAGQFTLDRPAAGSAG